MQTDMHEIALPPYLAHDLDAWKKGVEEKSRFLDCLWGGHKHCGDKRWRNHARAGAVSPRQVPLGEGRMTEAVDFVRRNFIASIPLISDLQRSFYRRYLMAKCGALFGSASQGLCN